MKSVPWAALLWATGSIAVAADQAFPTRPIRIVVPFPPGGGNDIIARVVAQKLAESWSQQVVVDNRPGAGGNIAAEIGARAAPDGHTLFQFNIANTMAPGLYRKLAYDPVRDFEPVTLMATTPFVLAVHPSVAARSVAELLALAKARPGTLNYGSSGSGSSSHLVTELFRSMAGIELVHVPYGGAGPAMTDVLSGQLQLMFFAVGPAIPHLRTGRLRGLGTSELKRVSLLPDLPSIAESGVPGYASSAWYGVAAPARTPPAILAKLNLEITRLLRLPEVRDRLTASGNELVASTPEHFARHIRSEIDKWARVVKASGARVE